MTTVAAAAGASRQVSRSNQPRRSGSRHSRSGTRGGADHQPYSCSVPTTGGVTRSGSSPIQGEKPNWSWRRSGSPWSWSSRARSAPASRPRPWPPSAPDRDPGSPYAAALAGTDAAWARVYRLAPGPAAAGRAVARAATSAHPRPRYVVPALNRLVVAALTVLPTPAADTAKRRIMGLPGRPPSPGSGTGPPGGGA